MKARASCFAKVFTVLHSRVLTRWHGCASIVVRYSRDRSGTLTDAMLSLALAFDQCPEAGAFIRAAKKFYADPSSAEEVVKILDVHISSSVR